MLDIRLEGEDTMGALSPPRAPKGFFSLPAKVRKRIFESILIVTHPIYLFQGNGTQVEVFAPEKPRNWLAPLQTSRQMHKEASAVLYGSNLFNLVDTTDKQPDLLHSFLACIGSLNSGALTHLCIKFPGVEKSQDRAQRYTLTKESLSSLYLLQQECTCLKTLEVFIYGQKASGLAEVIEDSPILATKALSQIDAQLNEIDSLVNVTVRVYDRSMEASLKQPMQDLGWTVLRAD
ncbi:unnamed protein product [Clonostachys rhizophaga]|uniref:Uncharacterized protein n=1 Tax=Clonostachys rhizophaga TaxID=160324 RepID=A0A9N9YRZ4_9HYPO|nr:unnamed protein product [Clonostachys rhizophaga]